jgi:hypothetical protein
MNFGLFVTSLLESFFIRPSNNTGKRSVTVLNIDILCSRVCNYLSGL